MMHQTKRRARTKFLWKILPVIGVFSLSGLFLSVDRADFSVDRLRAHIQKLASPEFEGRGPLTKGETATISYLTHQFEDLKLKPLASWNGFSKGVPLASIDTQPSTTISFGNAQLELNQDIAIKSSSTNENISFAATEVVFVGFGISSEHWDWDDYADIDVKGKIVIALVNDPGYYQKHLFRGKDMTYFGRWKYKFEEAQRKGARGALVVHNAEAAGYGWSVAASGEHNYVVNRNTPHVQPLELHGWITEQGARKIFAASGKDFDTIKDELITDPHAGAFTALPQSQLTMTMKNVVERGNSANLCGVLTGQTLPEEYVMVSAHWDHLGKKIIDGKEQIFPGAIDNASGVAAMLELARYLNRQKQLKRSVLFCSFTAEERGLLGGKHFADNPPFPLGQLKGIINFDSLNVGPKNNRIQLYGSEETTLGPLLHKSAKKFGRTVIDDQNGERGYFYRSDHYPFVLRGVKRALLFLDIGFSQPNYLVEDYHQPTDVFHKKWPLLGLVDDLALYADLVTELANEDEQG